MNESPIPVSIRRTYAIGTITVGAVSLVMCGLITAALGGTGQAIILASAALTVGIVIALAPVIVGVSMQSFGMAIVAASGARFLTALAIVVLGTAAMDLARKPIGLGIGAGLLIALIAETILAMTVINRVNRKAELT